MQFHDRLRVRGVWGLQPGELEAYRATSRTTSAAVLGAAARAAAAVRREREERNRDSAAAAPALPAPTRQSYVYRGRALRDRINRSSSAEHAAANRAEAAAQVMIKAQI
jgi:hypothetical protein